MQSLQRRESFLHKHQLQSANITHSISEARAWTNWNIFISLNKSLGACQLRKHRAFPNLGPLDCMLHAGVGKLIPQSEQDRQRKLLCFGNTDANHKGNLWQDVTALTVLSETVPFHCIQGICDTEHQCWLHQCSLVSLSSQAPNKSDVYSTVIMGADLKFGSQLFTVVGQRMTHAVMVLSSGVN